ncbi:hypothetical protein AURDEDRAFT_90579 [Auricularia subglabra TFB-10046 SS5]|nr:hypothetical protein AURDEDRAFT_90579 [Auricularia subglabra TFB-10046 SS5]
MTSRSAATSAYLSTLPEFGSSARIASLYSDIARKKQSNPASFQSTVSWWQRTLQDLVARGLQGDANSDKLILHVNNDLVEGLRWQKAGKPLGLGSAVVESAVPVSSGVPPKLIPLQTFLDAGQSIYTPSSLIYRVASYMVGTPLWWALEQLSIVDGERDVSAEDVWKRARGDYVVLPNLERAAEAVIQKQSEEPRVSLTSSLYTFDSFRTTFAACALPDVTLSDADLKALIRYLSRDKGVIVSDKEVIKFVEPEEEHAITEVDRGVLQMETAVVKLEAQVAEIQKQISERAEKISTALRAAQKTLAMSYLRSRKQLEDLLSKRLGALETLQTQLSTVERAVGDAEIMEAYEKSTHTLRAALADPRLQRDRVEATMDGMAEALADHREIEDAMKLGEIGIVPEADEDELAAELAGLQDEVRREKEQEERQRAEELARKLEAQRVPVSDKTEPAKGKAEEERVRDAQEVA